MTYHMATHKLLNVSLNFLWNALSNVSNVSNGENSPQKQHLMKENKKRIYKMPYLYGWGGRIRTYGTRYQKPMPYRLATPQHKNLFTMVIKKHQGVMV